MSIPVTLDETDHAPLTPAGTWRSRDLDLLHSAPFTLVKYGLEASTSIARSDEHTRKAPEPMLLTLRGIVTVAREVHSENAQLPMLVAP